MSMRCWTIKMGFVYQISYDGNSVGATRLPAWKLSEIYPADNERSVFERVTNGACCTGAKRFIPVLLPMPL